MKKVRYYTCLFAKSSVKGIYTRHNANEQFPFEFLKFEPPRTNYLIKAGVTWVMQSWRCKGSEKILHTGLIPFRNKYYLGNNINAQQRLDFILLVLNKLDNSFLFVLVKNRHPKNKILFANAIITQLEIDGVLI